LRQWREQGRGSLNLERVGMTEYEKMMDERNALNERHRAAEDAIKAGFEAELAAAYKAKFPKRKRYSSALSFKNNPEEHNAIFLKWQEKASSVMEIHGKDRAELEVRVKAVAAVAEIPPFEGMTIFRTVSSSSYNSQGFGAHKYARAAAENCLDKAKSYGIDGHIREVLISEGRDTFGWSFRVVDYEVWVATDEAGVEILDRKPFKASLKEWNQKCRERGVNIRVFLPFMSDDQEAYLESKIGKEA